MSSTPEPDGAAQWSGDTQQGALSRPPSQGSAPGAERHAGGQPVNGAQPGRAARRRAPVSEAQTRVSGRRVVQYWIDAFLVSIVPYLVSIPFDRGGSTFLHVLGGIITFVVFLIIGFWYWVVRPRSHSGQTFAMKWFGLHVVSKNGGPASTVQYFTRWIGLIIDGFPWVWPFTGILGLIVMVSSRYRQRVGDHLARTLVIAEGLTADQASQYAVDGASGVGGISGPGEPSGTLDDPLPRQERPETGL